MTQQKTARLILHGIGIIRILIGSLVVIAALGMLLQMHGKRESSAVLWGSLVFPAVLLPLGVYFTYASYRLLRRGAFAEVTRDISALLPACVFLVIKPVYSWADTLPGRDLARHVELATVFGVLLLYCLGVAACTRLAKRLVKTADGENGDSHLPGTPDIDTY